MDLDHSSWSHLSTSVVSDALDRLQICGQCQGIKGLTTKFRAVGRAFTVKMLPLSVDGGTVGDYIDEVSPGHVVVIDNNGRTDVTVWGDLLTNAAHRRGISGTVIFGVCRDSTSSLEVHYPIFSLGTHMRTGKDRVQADGFNVPIAVGGVRVLPNDLIVADADGVVVVPQSREAEVLAAAIEIQSTEERILAAISSGTRVDQARKQFGYFELQRPGGKSHA